MLKPLPIYRSAADANISIITFIAHVGFDTQELAHLLDSLVRVSRRVEWNHFVTVVASGRCQRATPQPSKLGATRRPTTRPHSKIAVCWRVLPSTFACPWTNYHVPGGILTTTQAMTHKARGIAHSQIKAQSTTCMNAKSNH